MPHGNSLQRCVHSEVNAEGLSIKADLIDMLVMPTIRFWKRFLYQIIKISDSVKDRVL